MVPAGHEVILLDRAPAIGHLPDLLRLGELSRRRQVTGHDQPVRAAIRLTQVAERRLQLRFHELYLRVGRMHGGPAQVDLGNSTCDRDLLEQSGAPRECRRGGPR